MNLFLNFIIIFFSLFLNRTDSSSLENHLTYFETINLEDINHHISKRSIDSSNSFKKEFKQIEFNAFNQRFRLSLNEKTEILSNNFKAFTINENGEKKEIKFKLDEFYEGNLIGKVNSDVTAHINKQTGLITGSIYDDDEKESYFIEPYSNLSNQTKDNNFMIIYRQKDIKDQHLNNELKNKLNQTLNSFCGYIKINDTVNTTLINSNNRLKRQLDDDNFWSESKLENTKCSLRLVADYTFVENMGNNDTTKTINFLVNLVSEVDTIYKRTNFSYTNSDNEPMIGYGFLVTEILIHQNGFRSSDLYSSNLPHYNTKRDKWKVRELLESFSREGTHKSFCLSHLFTHRTFENGILGLAYVSSPRQYSYGGICSQPYYKDGGFLYLNTGLTTTKNSFGNRVLTRQAVLITAHELGHNFGAEHDPSVPECSPKAKYGGAYIMNTFSVSSYDANNQFFSICSKRSIKSVLKVKAKDCFSKPKSTFCGNGIVEKGEECDSGLTSSDGPTECCTKNCRLKAGARCNDINSPCCNGCRYSYAGKVCLDSNELDCKRESYCSGFSSECPLPQALPDNTRCSEDGYCLDGECKSFCEKHGLLPCMCDNLQDGCRKCCKQNLNSTCLPFQFNDGSNHFHRDGTICLRGFCSKGKCLNVSQDYVERFWSIIDDIEYNSFTMFLKDNLVCCVIFVSFFVFIPAWYFIEKYDQKMKDKLERSKEKSRMRTFLNQQQQQYPSSIHNHSRSQRKIPLNRQQFCSVPKTRARRVLDESSTSYFNQSGLLSPTTEAVINNSNNSNNSNKKNNDSTVL